MIEALGIATRRSTHRVRHALQLVIKGHGRALAGVAGTAFSGGVAEALFLVVLTRTAFAITGGDDVVEIMVGRSLSVERALLLAFVLVMLRLVLSGWATWQSSRLSSNVVARVRHRLAGAFFDASWEVQQGQRAGSLQELLTGYSTQANVLMTALTNVVVSGANLVALTAIAIAVDPLGALVLVVALAVLGLLLRPLRAAVKRRAHDATSAGMDLATSVGDLADLGLELHVFHVQGAARDRVGELIERTRETQRWYLLTAGLTAPIYTGLAYLALLGALGAVALSDATSLTSLGAVMLVMLRSLAYGQGVQIGYTNLWATTPAIEEIQGRLEVFEGARPHEGTTRVNEVGQIAVSDLSFAYEPDHPVLRNVSFTIERREIVGIVGPSGGGKSTLVQLLLGLREPDEGSIRADGRDVSSFAKSEWARRVTFVPQASHLIAGTISENIRFMRDGVGRDDIERAARLAHLHDDITAFADGYERQVGEHGGHLSGGQQQRLCIARALVEHPDVMILDEPTSALDVRSEHLLRTTLFGLKEQMTVVIIAHRLSTLDICDRIMVIQGGELRGFDTPQNLEQSSGFYREALVLSGLR